MKLLKLVKREALCSIIINGDIMKFSYKQYKIMNMQILEWSAFTKAGIGFPAFVDLDKKNPGKIRLNKVEYLKVLINGYNYRTKNNQKTLTKFPVELSTGKNVNLTYSQYLTMGTYITEWLIKTGKNLKVLPNYVTVQGRYKVFRDSYIDAIKRVINFRPKNSGKNPNTVEVKLNSDAKVFASDKDVTLTLIANAIGGKFNTFTEFFKLICKNKTYSYYNNDIYTQKQAIQRLKTGYGLNCVDYTQIGQYVATKLDIPWKVVHKQCQTGGHVLLQLYINGKWTWVDLAAAANNCAKNGYFGAGWCLTGKTLGSWGENSTFPSWIRKYDGVTF